MSDNKTALLNETACRVYDAIVRYKMKNDGCAPTIRWLTKACGLGSTNTVFFNLQKLEDAGLIERGQDGESRLIKVTGGDWGFGNDESART